jgi:hypothetical protein
VIVNADVVDGPARNRPVRWRSDQGARGEVFPLVAVAALGGIHIPRGQTAPVLPPMLKGEAQNDRLSKGGQVVSTRGCLSQKMARFLR